MTKNQIECTVERWTDHVDLLLLHGVIDQDAYDTIMRDIDEWVERNSGKSTYRGDPAA